MKEVRDKKFSKAAVDDRLSRIANVLLLNASFIDNLGLLNGKMGIAIFFFRYGRFTGNKVFTDYAGELIDEIYEDINSGTPVNFEDGLTGIGWGFHFLIKNKFIEGDPDEVLSELDDLIYLNSLYRPLLLETNNSLFGYGFYYFSRFENHKRSPDKLSPFFSMKHLDYLISFCDRLGSPNKSHEIKMQELGVDAISSLIWFLNKVTKTNFSHKEVDRLLSSLQRRFERLLSSLLELSSNSQIGDMISYWRIKPNKKKIRNPIEIDNNKLDKEETIARSIKNFVRLSWQSFIYEPDNHYPNKISIGKVNRILKLIDFDGNRNPILVMLNNNNLSLNGLAGLGLGLLSYGHQKSSLKFKQNFSSPDSTTNIKSKMVNLVIIIHDFSGAKTYTDELCDYLVDNKSVFVTKIYLDFKGSKELLIRSNGKVQLIYVPNRVGHHKINNYFKSAALLIYSELKFLRNVVIHTNDIHQFSFAKELKNLFHCPVVFTLHFMPNFYSFIDQYAGFDCDITITGNNDLVNMLALSDHIICVTAFTKRIISNYYKINLSKISLIYNGKRPPEDSIASTEVLKSSYGFSNEDQILLYAGQLEPRKGIDKLIKAFLLLKDKFPALKLVIAGKGNYDNYFSFAQECIGRIYFAGKLDTKKLSDFYRFSLIGLLPSAFEQCSYSAIEMMQHELPLIISNVPGLNELVAHKKTGLVCKVRTKNNMPFALEVDEVDLSLQIEYLLLNGSVAKKLSQSARCKAEKHFSIEKMGDETFNIYKNIQCDIKN